MTLHSSDLLRQWGSILGVAALAIAGEVIIASAMRDLGDLDNHRTGPGLKGFLGPVKAVLSSPKFLIGAACMALNFFGMLWALSIVDLSLAAPAIAALTYIGNAICAKLVLGENVDRRRWLAVLFVCVGVILISH
ncbi:MAG TPA: EamA family transporter [Edaphobacter sp.]